VLLILRHQVNHRLPAIAGFAVHVFKQQQRGGAAAVKQFAVGRLRIQQILRQQIAQENAQRWASSLSSFLMTRAHRTVPADAAIRQRPGTRADAKQ
jgi:hypothetical protein